MFSFLKSKPEPEPVAENPLAAPVETPDVPRPQEQSGMNVGALLEPPAAPAASSQIGPKDEARTAELMPKVVEAISTVFDPEIPVNIYELGLVYDILVGADRRVLVKMTLTSPNCPSAQSLPSEVRYRVKAVPGVSDAQVEIVWEPPWSMDKMSDVARLQLGLM